MSVVVQAIKRDEIYIAPEGIYVETHQPERRSRKPPLLLVHGALTGSWMWSGFAAFFAERGWGLAGVEIDTALASYLDEPGARPFETDPPGRHRRDRAGRIRFDKSKRQLTELEVLVEDVLRRELPRGLLEVDLPAEVGGGDDVLDLYLRLVLDRDAPLLEAPDDLLHGLSRLVL